MSYSDAYIHRTKSKKARLRHDSRKLLKNLLRDATFADYFNVFLNLPVFGQRALFKLHSKKFLFNPTILCVLHNHRVLDWIQEERYPLFIQTRLAHEYKLSCLLQKINFSLQIKDEEQTETTDLLRTFCRNLIGSVAGMYLFREYLRGTNGSRVVACWMHVQVFRNARDLKRRLELFSSIRQHYMKPVVSLPSPDCLSDIVASELLNFAVVPVNYESLAARMGTRSLASIHELDPKSQDALVHVQLVLLTALQTYWLPCYIHHVLSSYTVENLEAIFSLYLSLVPATLLSFRESGSQLCFNLILGVSTQTVKTSKVILTAQQLFKSSPDDKINKEAVKRFLGRSAIFKAFSQHPNSDDGFSITSSSMSLPVIRPILSVSTSTDGSDVEILYTTAGDEGQITEEISDYENLTYTWEQSPLEEEENSTHTWERSPLEEEENLTHTWEQSPLEEEENLTHTWEQSPLEEEGYLVLETHSSSATPPATPSPQDSSVGASSTDNENCNKLCHTFSSGTYRAHQVDVFRSVSCPEFTSDSVGYSGDYNEYEEETSSGQVAWTFSGKSRTVSEADVTIASREESITDIESVRSSLCRALTNAHRSVSEQGFRQRGGVAHGDHREDTHIDGNNLNTSACRCSSATLVLSRCQFRHRCCTWDGRIWRSSSADADFASGHYKRKLSARCITEESTVINSEFNRVISQIVISCGENPEFGAVGDLGTGTISRSFSEHVISEPVVSSRTPRNFTCNYSTDSTALTYPEQTVFDSKLNGSLKTDLTQDQGTSNSEICSASKTRTNTQVTSDSSLGNRVRTCITFDRTNSELESCKGIQGDTLTSSHRKKAISESETSNSRHTGSVTCKFQDQVISESDGTQNCSVTSNISGQSLVQTDVDRSMQKGTNILVQSGNRDTATERITRMPGTVETSPMKAGKTSAKNAHNITTDEDSERIPGVSGTFGSRSSGNRSTSQSKSNNASKKVTESDTACGETSTSDALPKRHQRCLEDAKHFSHRDMASCSKTPDPENSLDAPQMKTCSGTKPVKDQGKTGPQLNHPFSPGSSLVSLGSSLLKSDSTSCASTDTGAQIGSSCHTLTPPSPRRYAVKDRSQNARTDKDSLSPTPQPTTTTTAHETTRRSLCVGQNSDEKQIRGASKKGQRSGNSHPQDAVTSLEDHVTSFDEINLKFSSRSSSRCLSAGSQEKNNNQPRGISWAARQTNRVDIPNGKPKAGQVLGQNRSVFSSSSDSEHSSSSGKEDGEDSATMDEEERSRRMVKKERQRLKEKQEMKKWRKVAVELRELGLDEAHEARMALRPFSVANVTRVALRDMIFKREEVTPLSSLLLHYIFGSRDINKEDPKTDRRTLCLLACDGCAGSPLHNYLKTRGQVLHTHYLNFWSSLRRYLQLRDYCHMDNVAGRENNADVVRLLQQQIHHVAQAFLADTANNIYILTDKLKLQILDDMLNKRQTTLMNAAQDVVSNVLGIPATQYVLHDQHVFESVVFRTSTPELPEGVAGKARGIHKTFSGLPTRVPSAALRLAERFQRNLPRKTFRQRRCLSDPWYGDILPNVKGDPEQHADEMSGVVGVLTENHRLQAFQYTIMIGEDIHTYPMCDVKDLCEMIWSDFGSLHIHRTPPVRNRNLRRILPYKRQTKEELSQLSVVSTSYLNAQFPPNDIDPVQIGEVKEGIGLGYQQLQRLKNRRGAQELDFPTYPMKFADVLDNEYQCMFFRLFLISQGPGFVEPLNFYKACQHAGTVLTEDSTRTDLLEIISNKYLLGDRRQHLLIAEKNMKSIDQEPLSLNALTSLQQLVMVAMEKKWWNEYIRSRPTRKSLLDSREGLDEAWVVEIAGQLDDKTHLLVSDTSTESDLEEDEDEEGSDQDSSSSEGSDSEEEGDEQESEEDEYGERVIKRKRRKPRYEEEEEEEEEEARGKRVRRVKPQKIKFQVDNESEEEGDEDKIRKKRLQGRWKTTARSERRRRRQAEEEFEEDTEEDDDESRSRRCRAWKSAGFKVVTFGRKYKSPRSARRKSKSESDLFRVSEEETGDPQSNLSEAYLATGKMKRKRRKRKKKKDEETDKPEQELSIFDTMLQRLGLMTVIAMTTMSAPVKTEPTDDLNEIPEEEAPEITGTAEDSDAAEPDAEAEAGTDKKRKKKKKGKKLRGKKVEVKISEPDPALIGKARARKNWGAVIKRVAEFMRSVRDFLKFRDFEDFLSREIDKARENNEKVVSVPGMPGPVYSRIISNTPIIVNKLPSDLQFLVDVDRYQMEYTTALKERENKEDPLSPEVLGRLRARAMGIISYFLTSETAPSVKVNLTNPEAYRVVTSFMNEGPTIGLFHQPVIVLAPVLLRLWGGFVSDCLEKKRFSSRNHKFVGDSPHEGEISVDLSSSTHKMEVHYVDTKSHSKVPGLDSPTPLAVKKIVRDQPSGGAQVSGKVAEVKQVPTEVMFSICGGLKMFLPLTDEMRKKLKSIEDEKEKKGGTEEKQPDAGKAQGEDDSKKTSLTIEDTQKPPGEQKAQGKDVSKQVSDTTKDTQKPPGEQKAKGKRVLSRRKAQGKDDSKQIRAKGTRKSPDEQTAQDGGSKPSATTPLPPVVTVKFQAKDSRTEVHEAKTGEYVPLPKLSIPLPPKPRRRFSPLKSLPLLPTPPQLAPHESETKVKWGNDPKLPAEVDLERAFKSRPEPGRSVVSRKVTSVTETSELPNLKEDILGREIEAAKQTPAKRKFSVECSKSCTVHILSIGESSRKDPALIDWKKEKAAADKLVREMDLKERKLQMLEKKQQELQALNEKQAERERGETDVSEKEKKKKKGQDEKKEGKKEKTGKGLRAEEPIADKPPTGLRTAERPLVKLTFSKYRQLSDESRRHTPSERKPESAMRLFIKANRPPKEPTAAKRQAKRDATSSPISKERLSSGESRRHTPRGRTPDSSRRKSTGSPTSTGQVSPGESRRHTPRGRTPDSSRRKSTRSPASTGQVSPGESRRSTPRGRTPDSTRKKSAKSPTFKGRVSPGESRRSTPRGRTPDRSRQKSPMSSAPKERIVYGVSRKYASPKRKPTPSTPKGRTVYGVSRKYASPNRRPMSSTPKGRMAYGVSRKYAAPYRRPGGARRMHVGADEGGSLEASSESEEEIASVSASESELQTGAPRGVDHLYAEVESSSSSEDSAEQDRQPTSLDNLKKLKLALDAGLKQLHCAERVSAMVDQLNNQRQNDRDARSGAGAGTGKEGKGAGKGLSKAQVLGKLYSQRSGQPHPPALFRLKSEESGIRERWSAQSRMAAYGKREQRVPVKKVTTPDLAELQKRKRQQRRKYSDLDEKNRRV